MFDDLDEAFERAPAEKPDGRPRAPITAAQYAALPAPEIRSGYYTLTLTDGSRKRFRVRLERGTFCTGKRTLARYCKLESDDDQEREWETLGLVDATGFNLFKRWRSAREAGWAAAIWALAHGLPAPGYSLEVEPRCGMTMRVLADDDAKRTGLCRKWRKEFGVE